MRNLLWKKRQVPFHWGYRKEKTRKPKQKYVQEQNKNENIEKPREELWRAGKELEKPKRALY